MSNRLLDLSELLLAKNKKIVTAESCTGGLVAKICTDVAGSSAWFDRGFVTYSNQSKHDMLGVSLTDIDRFGAVSKQVIKQMAFGAIANSQADYSLAISGIAGPDGGSDDKPVGMVWFGFAGKSKVITKCMNYLGDREQIRCQSAEYALKKIYKFITNN